MPAVIRVAAGRAKDKPKVVSDRMGEGIHDRPSEIPLTLFGQRDGLLRHSCLLTDPCLCQPGRLAGRSQVFPELPENLVRTRISGYPPPCHFVSISRFQNLGDI